MQNANRALLVSVAAVLLPAGLLGGLYAWQNQRGSRMWADTERELAAKGESLDRADFIPPPVPDEQNLAMAPLFERMYRYRVDPGTGRLTFPPDASDFADKVMDYLPLGKDGQLASAPGLGAGWMTGRPLDLTRYQDYYRRRADFPHAPQAQTPAADVRLALTRYTPLLDELARDAAERPLTRFPVNWTQRPSTHISLPQGVFLGRACATLRLRASAELADGQPAEAMQDLLLGFRLSRAMATESTLIGELVGLTSLGSLLQPIWDGLAARAWNAEQLLALQKELGAVDLIRDYKQAARAERASLVAWREDARTTEGMKNLLDSVLPGAGRARDNRVLVRMAPLAPPGWFDEAEAILCRLDQEVVIDPVDPAAHRIRARQSEAGADKVNRLPLSWDNFLPKETLPIYPGIVARIAREQAAADEAAVACALERYFLAHQAYPDGLDALVPAFLDRLPTDVIDGGAMHYQRTAEGRYRLWEVGWNGTDEGGIVAWSGGASPRVDDKRGDWTWQYEPAQAGSGTAGGK